MSELINDEAVCRTAPATPGLLIRNIKNFIVPSIIRALVHESSKSDD